MNETTQTKVTAIEAEYIARMRRAAKILRDTDGDCTCPDCMDVAFAASVVDEVADRAVASACDAVSPTVAALRAEVDRANSRAEAIVSGHGLGMMALSNALGAAPHEPLVPAAERLRAEVERLTRERDEARAAGFCEGRDAAADDLDQDGEAWAQSADDHGRSGVLANAAYRNSAIQPPRNPDTAQDTATPPTSPKAAPVLGGAGDTRADTE